MNCLKKVFSFSWGGNFKKGPGFFGGINKKIMKKIELFLAFRSSSTYRLSFSFSSSLLFLTFIPTDCATYLEFPQHSMSLQGFEPSHH